MHGFWKNCNENLEIFLINFQDIGNILSKLHVNFDEILEIWGIDKILEKPSNNY